jgi:mono/diheme cytochrome c family protein
MHDSYAEIRMKTSELYFPSALRWRSTMNDPKRFLVLLVVLFIASTGQAWQATPATYFEQNCSSCHTIGDGASVGPDLKNATQRASRHWLVEFIRDPDAKIAAKDPYATKIVAEAQGAVMTGSPDVTEEFGEALLEYIDQQSGAPVATAVPVVAGDAARGRELFLGKHRLSSGAAACIACHQASGLPLAGGRLGPDLSSAYQKLGDDRGLAAWLHNPPTRMMSTIFRSAPLTADEASDLTAFLHASTENSAHLSQAPVRRVQAIGLAGSLLVFLFAGVIWRGRIAIHGVRRQLIRNRGGQ